jgi:D-alanyl-D-alanine dipeptidase
MENAGFEHYANEWWHFTLREEPFADRYFDFPVARDALK